MLDEAIQRHLAPLLDRLAYLEEMLEGGSRQGRNAIQLGFVSELIDGQRVVVEFGKDSFTPPIKWASMACGETAFYRAPSVGELALVLNWAAGDRFTSSVAIVGISSAEHPLPSADPNKVIEKIGRHGWVEWDVETGELLIKAKRIKLDAEEVHATHELSDGVRKLSEDRSIYDDHDHNETQNVTKKPNQKQGKTA
ncbi:hypothetical protein [Aeromonas jandaei]|uniref:hypothetical protein n=1 Tax=Aeromonas jandaei TaxID=650 RepID=UPI002B05D5BD|nr:hypothetical protein [Aeromonas jandaei]